MSLSNIQGKMSRKEMKEIMAGSSYSEGGCTATANCLNGTQINCSCQGRCNCSSLHQYNNGTGGTSGGYISCVNLDDMFASSWNGC